MHSSAREGGDGGATDPATTASAGSGGAPTSPGQSTAPRTRDKPSRARATHPGGGGSSAPRSGGTNANGERRRAHRSFEKHLEERLRAVGISGEG